MRWFAWLLFVPLLAWAEHVEFSSVTRIEECVCVIEKKVFPCVYLEQAKKKYFVVFDQEGEYQQWEILSGSTAQLVWARDMI